MNSYSGFVFELTSFLFYVHSGDIERADEKGSTPLHVAAAYGHLQALEAIVNQGANLWALDNNGRTAAKVAAFYQKAECCRYLDTLAVRWEVQNRDYVERQQLKAMKDLKKRAKKASDDHKEGKSGAAKAKKLLYNYATAPSGMSPSMTDARKPRASSVSADDGGKKKKLSTQDALRQNFELRPSQSSDEIEDKAKTSQLLVDNADGPIRPNSAGSTFRPMPRMNTGPLLNTLQSLAQKPARMKSADDPRRISPESGFVLQGSSSDTMLSAHGRGTSNGGSRTLLPEFDAAHAGSRSQTVTENNSSLATFLQSLDLIECIQVLHREKLDLEALALCNEQDLVGIGLPLGPRKKILHAIQRRREVMANPGKFIDSEL